MKLKQFIQRAVALVLFAAGLWTPFWIGGDLLPSGWAMEGTYWWTFPMMFTLGFGGFGMLVGGVALFIQTFDSP